MHIFINILFNPILLYNEFTAVAEWKNNYCGEF